MTDRKVVIGLEIHIQLNTDSKVFCGCDNSFGGDANTHSCPRCLGMPGVLPVFNKDVLTKTMTLASAVGAKIADECQFVRKNYFYPDLPKGYQISQFDQCVANGGGIEIEVGGKTKFIGLDRIQIEEDAGKSVHGEDSGILDSSLVDVNRCGTPLLEVISLPNSRSPVDPDLYLSSPDEAHEYLMRFKQIAEYLGISDCNMEEGNLRCDANISIWDHKNNRFGTRTEIKNLNSFRFARQALVQEMIRQTALIEDGGKVIQETLLFDPATQRTAPMRSKEEAHDYRYFPEPDLVPLIISDQWKQEVVDSLPEMPRARRERFGEQYGLPEDAAALLTAERAHADYFEETVQNGAAPKRASNWMLTELFRELNERKIEIDELAIEPNQLAQLISLVDDGSINAGVGKEVMSQMADTGTNPSVIVEEKGLVQISDSGELEEIVGRIMTENPDESARFRDGATKLMGFFVGQVMRETKGQANPKLVNELLREKLGSA